MLHKWEHYSEISSLSSASRRFGMMPSNGTTSWQSCQFRQETSYHQQMLHNISCPTFPESLRRRQPRKQKQNKHSRGVVGGMDDGRGFEKRVMSPHVSRFLPRTRPLWVQITRIIQHAVHHLRPSRGVLRQKNFLPPAIQQNRLLFRVC
jgi:hypothetical protein